MKLVEILGRDDEDENYINIKIEGGDRSNCIGDQVWINGEGTELMIYVDMSDSTLEEVIVMFDSLEDKVTFRKAMTRLRDW